MPIARMVVVAFAKTFSKLFGVATITFFGRAPSRDDDKTPEPPGGLAVINHRPQAARSIKIPGFLRQTMDRSDSNCGWSL